MNVTETKTVPIEEIVGKICDVCKTQIDANDYFDFNEMVNVRFTGGYNSIFGDGAKVEIDICQICFKEKLGEYVRIKIEG
jgi:hypothetical protein